MLNPATVMIIAIHDYNMRVLHTSSEILRDHGRDILVIASHKMPLWQALYCAFVIRRIKGTRKRCNTMQICPHTVIQITCHRYHCAYIRTPLCQQ